MAEESPAMPDKYIVFKRSDWDEKITEKLGHNAAELQRLYAVEDAVVLRMQDVFAGSVFYQYANSVQTTAEILSAIGGEVLQEEVDQLLRIADRFVDFGIAASDRDTKLPD